MSRAHIEVYALSRERAIMPRSSERPDPTRLPVYSPQTQIPEVQDPTSGDTPLRSPTIESPVPGIHPHQSTRPVGERADGPRASAVPHSRDGYPTVSLYGDGSDIRRSRRPSQDHVRDKQAADELWFRPFLRFRDRMILLSRNRRYRSSRCRTLHTRLD